VTNEEAHRFAREKGVSRVLVLIARAIIVPFLSLWFRLRIEGEHNIPADGPAIIAPNHKSFWDSFFVACATRRDVRFMGKSELFSGWQGPLLVRLGAFPVRRGESDQDALDTARTILRQGGVLALFPEGTRIRDPEGLGSPKRGAGRLALETGAPIVPAAITGTERLFAGPFPRPVRVQIAFGEPIPVTGLEPTPEEAARITSEALWPEVEERFESLVTRPGLIVAALTAVGVGGAVALRRRRRRR
jgi:1-acyl-sn-glycerol-3-phosphate acyltransferase